MPAHRISEVLHAARHKAVLAEALGGFEILRHWPPPAVRCVALKPTVPLSLVMLQWINRLDQS